VASFGTNAPSSVGSLREELASRDDEQDNLGVSPRVDETVGGETARVAPSSTGNVEIPDSAEPGAPSTYREQRT
jgi:hypothetical protein